jgi:phosphoribosylaminoimidazole carboxylase
MMPSPVIGVLGGGQLGRMLSEAAHRLNIKLVFLDAGNAPAKQIDARSNHINGSFTDPEAVRQLAQICDLLTVEIEHVNTDILEEISTGTETRPGWRVVPGVKVEVQPSWRTIRVIQDKSHQKSYLVQHGISSALSTAIENNRLTDLEDVGKELGYPFMLKSRTDAYDGRGNYPVKSVSDIQSALAALKNRPLYAEQWADFKAELAVMVVKVHDDAIVTDWQTATMAFPVVETVHQDSICKLVYAPARNVSPAIIQHAQELARRAVAGLWGKGVFGVELFLLSNGKRQSEVWLR